MRVIVFFDLPTITATDRKAYTNFRKYLIKSGFMMEQESVYSKLAVNSAAADAIAGNVRKNSPDKGLVQLSVLQKNNIQKWSTLLAIEMAKCWTRMRGW